MIFQEVIFLSAAHFKNESLCEYYDRQNKDKNRVSRQSGCGKIKCNLEVCPQPFLREFSCN